MSSILFAVIIDRSAVRGQCKSGVRSGSEAFPAENGIRLYASTVIGNAKAFMPFLEYSPRIRNLPGSPSFLVTCSRCPPTMFIIEVRARTGFIRKCEPLQFSVWYGIATIEQQWLKNGVVIGSGPTEVWTGAVVLCELKVQELELEQKLGFFFLSKSNALGQYP
ncbi:hypothetical protein Tco_1282143 [Tanacetum coccineum]